MYKTLYQTESNLSDIKTLSKDILKAQDIRILTTIQQ